MVKIKIPGKKDEEYVRETNIEEGELILLVNAAGLSDKGEKKFAHFGVFDRY